MSTPLVDWLRAQDDDTLAGLLRLRPDLAVPPPADLTVLATRAGIRASVHRACDELDTVALHVVEALVVADADSAPVPVDEVRRLLGPDLPSAVLDAALAALRARALAWDASDPDTSGARWAGISLVPAARDVVSRFPGGLGRPAAGVVSSSALPRLLAEIDPDERRVLDTLAAGPPVGRSRSGADPDQPGRPAARPGAARPRRRRDGRAAPPGRAGVARRPSAGCARRRPAGRHDRRARGGRRRRDGRRRRAAGAAPGRADRRALGRHPARGAPLGRPGRARPAADRARGGRRRGGGRAAGRDRGGGGPGGGERGRRAGVGADDGRGRLVRGRARAAVGGARPGLAGPAPPARPGRLARRCRPADRRAVRRPAQADRPARPAPGALRAGRAAAGHRGGNLRSPDRPARVAGTAARWTAARRGGHVDAGRGDRAGRRRARRRVDPGSGAARRSGPRRGRAARRAARARPPRPAAGRPDGRGAGSARPRAGARAGPRGRGRVGGRRHRLPVHRGHRPARPGRRAHRGRAARAVRDAVGHPGAAGPDLPRRRRRAPARSPARWRGAVVPALRRRGADRRGAGLPGRRTAGAAPDRRRPWRSHRCRSPR